MPKDSNKQDSKIKSDLLDKTKPLRMARKDELTDDFLKEAIRLDVKLWIGNLENKEIIKALNLDPTKPIKLVAKGSGINHILKRHGENAPLVTQTKQPAVTLNDIKTHDLIVNDADMFAISKTNDGQPAVILGKQINGYHIVIEVISVKKNELLLKTEFKENGILDENNPIFKNASDVVSLKAVSPTSAKTASNLDTSSSPTKKDSTKNVENMQDSKDFKLSLKRE